MIHEKCLTPVSPIATGWEWILCLLLCFTHLDIIARKISFVNLNFILFYLLSTCFLPFSYFLPFTDFLAVAFPKVHWISPPSWALRPHPQPAISDNPVVRSDCIHPIKRLLRCKKLILPQFIFLFFFFCHGF